MSLFDLITPDSTLLTPNRRLAAATLTRYDQQQLKQNKHCWQSLDILPLTSWIERLWKSYHARKMAASSLLLSSNQKTILWETILRQSPASDSLIKVSATAELAASAYELLKLWDIDLTEPELDTTEDSHVFLSWAKEYQKRCKKNQWIDNSAATNLIIEKILNNDIILPKQLILIGFTEISPQHTRLLKACEQQGCRIVHYNAPTEAKTIYQLGLTDEETEIRTMARWAKATYEASTEKRPYLIGCVVPRLESLRETVLQIFAETFIENDTFTLNHSQQPFNISAGKSLAAFPVIFTALELLKLSSQAISLETISSILQSPFLGEAEQERLGRAYFESRLKSLNVTTLSLDKLLNLLAGNCSALMKRFKNYANSVAPAKTKLMLSEWVKIFIEQLKLLGWPGERSLNSQEYQVTQRWLDLLSEYSCFDTIFGRQDFSHALDWLHQLTSNTIFQPQTPEAPIQILGMLEAAELPFQHLWVMGFDDNNWPAAPKPNPLIPQRLQKIAQMPHATTERELAYCDKLVRQLKRTAEHVIFSYPQQSDDIHLRPSSLLQDIPTLSLTDLPLSSFISPAQRIFTTQNIQLFTDENAPAISAVKEIAGGTHIFKQQAACPFKAFAELRLHARFIDSPTLGLRAIDRGNIVHKAMELLWADLKNSTALLALTQPELQDIVARYAKQAIDFVLQAIGDEETNQRYLALEHTRLVKLLLDWLKIESARPSFSVAFQEHEMNTEISGIPITLRVDRIDELEDGSQFIIDYKTGKHNEIRKWFGHRPDEPQLPLYCLVAGKTITGFAFGQIHPDDMALIGVSKKNIDIKSVKTLPEVAAAAAPYWEEQLLEWRIVLDNLGNDFLNGVARVDPKDVNQICGNCNLQTFCRIGEKDLT